MTRIRPLFEFLLVTIPVLVLFVLTLCPDLYWYDSAEFVNDAYLLDIPHPPGYPLFNLLTWLALKLPFGTIPARANFLSAVFSCLAVGFLFKAFHCMGASRSLAAAGSWTLAVAPQFWELGTVAEVYSMELAALAFCLYRIARLESSDQASPKLRWLALGLGVMLFHRPTTVLFVFPWLFLLRPRVLSWGPFLRMMALGALPYLHTAYVFFARPDTPVHRWSINYFDFPRNVATFLRICTGTLYSGNLHLLSLVEFKKELLAYLWFLRHQLGAPLTAVALYGFFAALLGSLPRFSRFLVSIVLGNVLFFLCYNALEKDTMYLPSIVAFLGLAILVLSPFCRDRIGRWAIPLILIGSILWNATSRWPEMDKSRYHEVRRCVDATAKLLPVSSAFYLTDDLIIHPFLHVMTVEGRRSDVSLVIVDGFGPEVEKGLRDRLARGYSVLSTLFYPDETFARVKRSFSLTPRGFLYELSTKAPPELPRQTGWTGRWNNVVLEGGQLYPKGSSFRGSDQIQVVLTWNEPEEGDPAVAFRLAPELPTSGKADAERKEDSVLSWVFPLGYQNRPRKGSRFTEEYLLKIPWNLCPGRSGRHELSLCLIPSTKRAIQEGLLRRTRTDAWTSSAFFKGMTESFIRCLERGWPAHSEVLEMTANGSSGQRWIDLRTVDLSL